VIEDARARQRKHRGIGAALIAAAVLAVGLILGFTGGGGGSRAGRGGLAPGPYETLSAPKPAVLVKAIALCDRQAGRGAAGSRFGNGRSVHSAYARGLVLSAAGGGYVGLIAVVQATMSVCVTAVHKPLDSPGIGAGGLPLTAPPSDKLNGAGLESTGALLGSESYGYGRAGSDVSAVEFVFPARRTVRARVENGWYIAWWPGNIGSNRPISVRVKTSTGTVSSAMPGPQCGSTGSCVFG
jgi:hypothetical protein